MKDTTAILDIAYPEVESKIKANLNNYKKFISKFINDRSTQLYANAPYNQPSDVEHKRFVSLSISFYTTVTGSPYMSDKDIENSIRESIEQEAKNHKFDIDELEILDD